MTPSPPDNLVSSTVINYGDSWQAIMHLVRSGYSWSGNERNCVFLNCTQTDGTHERVPRFANASAVSGLDFPDDGRSLAVVDWDGDGDQDLWFRNRTAPRLRLMRNRTNEISSDDRHISLRMTGTTCNRDAIGARAELILMTAATSSKRLVRSVRAGDGFLSQSSKWLHFGVPKDASVERLIVAWPGGNRENFSGISAGSRYEIKQGDGQATLWKPRKPVSLSAQPYEPIPLTAAARVVLPGKVTLPRIDLQSDDSAESVQLEFGDAPTLLTFWTSSCSNCRRELADIAKHHSEFEQARLNVVAICLDGLEDHGDAIFEETKDAEMFLRDIEFPFRAMRTTPETVDLIRHFQNVLFNKYPDFVVPLSLLLDSKGRLVSIYRGAFSHETLLQDRNLVDLDDETRRSMATPLVGTWITKPATPSQLVDFVGSRLIAKAPNAALRYFEALIKTETGPERQRALREQIKNLRLITERENMY